MNQRSLHRTTGYSFLISLRAYFDSSGKIGDNYMTLAAFAASEEMWAEFETEWQKILDGHTPKAAYVHMRELAHQRDGFAAELGWNNENAFGLSNKCLIYMSHLDKKRFRMFYCAVDLQAWRKLRRETYDLPHPFELCNEFCSKGVLLWYIDRYPDVISLETDNFKYFFDSGEEFKTSFEKKWKEEVKKSKRSGVWSVWSLIKQVSAVDMKKVPGVQAADILAWAVNRDATTGDGKKGKYFRHIMHQVIPASFVIWEETMFRKHFKPLLYLP